MQTENLIGKATTVGLLSYQAYGAWREISNSFWKVKKNVDNLKVRLEIKNAFRDPSFTARVEEFMRKRLNEGDHPKF
jgi:hypothetical protein